MHRLSISMLLAAWAVSASFPNAARADAADRLISDAAAAAHLGRFCVRCHGAAKAEAQFRLDLGPAAFPETTWEKLVDVLHDAAMPPEDEPQPTVAQRQELEAWARGHLDRLVLARAGDPGSVAGRRLTILELENMVRDLTGQAIPIRDLLGQDTTGGEGFTNIGSAQSSMTASLLDKYLALASRVTDHARFDEQGRLVFDPPGKIASPRVREDASIIDLMTLHARVLGGLYLGKGKLTTAPRDERAVRGKNAEVEGSWKGFGRYMTAIWLATAAPDPQAVLPQLAERMELNPRFLETVWDRWTTCPPDSLEHRAWVGPVKALPKPTAWTEEPPAAISLACDTAGAWFCDLVRGNLAYPGGRIPTPRTQAAQRGTFMFAREPLFTAVPARMVEARRMQKVPLAEFPVFVAVQQEPYWPLTGGQPVAGWLGWPQIRVTETRTETVDGKARQTKSSSYRPLPQEAVEVLSVAAGRQAGVSTAPAWEEHAFAGFGEEKKSLPALKISGSICLKIDVVELNQLDLFTADGKFRTGITADVVFPVAASGAETLLRIGICRERKGLDLAGFAKLVQLPTGKGERIEIAWMVANPATGEAVQKGLGAMLLRWPPLAPLQMAPFSSDRVRDVPAEMAYFRDDARMKEWAMSDAERQRADTLWRYNAMLCGEHPLRLKRFEERFGVPEADRYDPPAVQKILAGRRPAGGAAYPGEPDHGHGVVPYDLFERWQFYRRAAAEDAAFWRKQTLAAVEDFASRAWRRPLTPAERGRLATAYEETGPLALQDAEGVLRTLLTSVLVSPHFLYRMERGLAAGGEAPVSPWELATRLSLTIWASLPDEELRRHAADGSLVRDEVLKSQVRRMLADPKAGGTGIVEHFFGEWLGFVGFATSSRGPDASVFPEFTPQVRRALHGEATAFFTDIVRNDRDVRLIIAGGHSFLDATLRAYYRPEDKPDFKFAASVASADAGLSRELAGAAAPLEGFAVADMRPAGRGGVLGLGAILINNSRQKRTSPTNRGAWVAERLLGRHIPPPPPNVTPLPDEPVSATSLSLHEQLQRHSRDAACAGCHRRIDPYGYALEAFDANGRRRSAETVARLVAIEDADGRAIAGFDGLRDYLRDHETETLRSMARHFLGYALNRGALVSDRPILDEIVAELPKNDYRFSTLVERVVLSRQFRFRR
jgi:hypothetical protein